MLSAADAANFCCDPNAQPRSIAVETAALYFDDEDEVGGVGRRQTTLTLGDGSQSLA